MEILLKYLAVTVLKIILDVVNESPVLLHFTVVAGPPIDTQRTTPEFMS